MAVGVLQEFEGTTDQYDAVNAKLDMENNPAPGMIVHTASDIGGGKMRVYDVWESADAFEKFAEERLGPAIAEAVDDPSPPTVREVNELHDFQQA
jgi:hypothetical protein